MLLLRRKWLAFAMFMAMQGLVGCVTVDKVVHQEDKIGMECPYIEPILDFGKATAVDVRNREERVLYQDKWEKNGLITTQDRDETPWTAYVFNEEKRTLDFCVVVLPQSQMSEVVSYLNCRYGEVQREIDGVKQYVDNENGYSIMFASKTKYEGVIGLAYIPNARIDEILEKL